MACAARVGEFRIVAKLAAFGFASVLLSCSSGSTRTPPPNNAVRASLAPSPPRTDPSAKYHLPEDRFTAQISAEPRFRWRDERLGCEVGSDFERATIDSELLSKIETYARDLATLFPGSDPARLTIHVHDSPPVLVDGFQVNSFHRGREVHLFAGTPDSNALHETTESHLRHELVHAYCHLSGREFPRWLEEGLADALCELTRDAADSLVLLPRDDYAEVLARLSRTERAPRARELLVARDAYPDPSVLGAFYVGSWFLTWIALEDENGELVARLRELEKRSDAELSQLTERFDSLVKTFDPVALYAPLARRHDPKLDDLIEDRIRHLPVTRGFFDVVSEYASRERGDRLRATRMLSCIERDARFFQHLDPLLGDADDEVKRAAERALFGTPRLTEDGRGVLTRLAASSSRKTTRVAATLALGILGDHEALLRWIELALIEPDRARIVDAFLALARTLPAGAPIPSAEMLLDPTFDAVAGLTRLRSYWIAVESQTPH